MVDILASGSGVFILVTLLYILASVQMTSEERLVERFKELVREDKIPVLEMGLPQKSSSLHDWGSRSQIARDQQFPLILLLKNKILLYHTREVIELRDIPGNPRIPQYFQRYNKDNSIFFEIHNYDTYHYLNEVTKSTLPEGVRYWVHWAFNPGNIQNPNPVFGSNTSGLGMTNEMNNALASDGQTRQWSGVYGENSPDSDESRMNVLGQGPGAQQQNGAGGEGSDVDMPFGSMMGQGQPGSQGGMPSSGGGAGPTPTESAIESLMEGTRNGDLSNAMQYLFNQNAGQNGNGEGASGSLEALLESANGEGEGTSLEDFLEQGQTGNGSEEMDTMMPVFSQSAESEFEQEIEETEFEATEALEELRDQLQQQFENQFENSMDLASDNTELNKNSSENESSNSAPSGYVNQDKSESSQSESKNSRLSTDSAEQNNSDREDSAEESADIENSEIDTQEPVGKPPEMSPREYIRKHLYLVLPLHTPIERFVIESRLPGAEPFSLRLNSARFEFSSLGSDKFWYLDVGDSLLPQGSPDDGTSGVSRIQLKKINDLSQDIGVTVIAEIINDMAYLPLDQNQIGVEFKERDGYWLAEDLLDADRVKLIEN